MRLIVDQDGVLADQTSTLFKTVEQETGIKLCHYDIQDYWFKNMPVEPGYILDIMRRPGYFRSLDVITGAVRALQRLREDYDVIVCTSPLKGSYDPETEKREWLAEHFDKDLAETAVVTEHKARVMGRLIIEDNPQIDRNANWKVLMFHQPWNAQVEDLPRMYGWGDLAPVFDQMA